MRITLEPTGIFKKTDKLETTAPKVIVETPFDDLSFFDVWGLIKSALLAYGYSQETINKFEKNQE